MRFVSYSTGGESRPGMVDDGWCIDLALAAAYGAADLALNGHWQVPLDLMSFIAGGESNLLAARRLLDFARQQQKAGETVTNWALPVEQVQLNTPLPNPYLLGQMETNCAAQFDQRAWPRRNYPAMLLLPDNTLNAPGAPFVLPRWATRVSVSAQIALVCGRHLNEASEAEAEDGIFGYTLSLAFASSALVDLLENPPARDISINEDYGRWFDGCLPVGPYIVTKDAAGPLVSRSIQLNVGAQQTTTNTSAMLHTPARILSVLSLATPFYPGDIIGLGAMGPDVNLPSPLPPEGVRVAAEVEGLGRLETLVMEVEA